MPKTYNRKYKMNWQEHGKRWRKYYRGRMFYFKTGTNKSDKDGYDRAWAAFQQWKAQVDAEGTPKPQSEKPGGSFADLETIRGNWRQIAEELLSLADYNNDDDASQKALAAVQIFHELVSLRNSKRIPPLDAYDFDPIEDQEISGRSLDLLARVEKKFTEKSDPKKVLYDNAQAFLKYHQQRAEKGSIAIGRFDSIRSNINIFLNWFGESRQITEINFDTVNDYFLYLSGAVKSGEMSASYAKGCLQNFRNLITYLSDRDLINPPKNLHSKEHIIHVHAKPIDTFTLEEVHRTLEAASGKTKLYLLLMLNCGMQQQDIADLKQTEVNWEEGKICRRRSKTRNHKNPPTVEYKLWNETFELLKEYRSTDKTLALTNEKGLPLKSEGIVNGQATRNDNIRSAYRRVTDKTKITKPLKLLRKTSASLLNSHSEHSRHVELFLGHSPSSIADRHYTTAPQESFDRALEWLGKQILATPNKPK